MRPSPSASSRCCPKASEPAEAPDPPAPEEPMEISARRQTPVSHRSSRSEPRPFDPPVVQRERIIPEAAGAAEPAPPTRRFETDVFLERLRAASAILPDEDEELSRAERSAPPRRRRRARHRLQPEPADEPAEPEPAERAAGSDQSRGARSGASPAGAQATQPAAASGRVRRRAPRPRPSRRCEAPARQTPNPQRPWLPSPNGSAGATGG